MKKYLIMVPAAIGFFIACSPAQSIHNNEIVKDTIAPKPVTEKKAGEDSLTIMRRNYKDFMKMKIQPQTFAAKINLAYTEDNGKKSKFNVNLRMAYDSLIWVSATGLFGIEGMRALITTDSVFLLDKQNKNYTANSISYLQQLTGLPFTLITLQDLLLGNPVFWNEQNQQFERMNNNLVCIQNGPVFRSKLTVDSASKLLQECYLNDIDTTLGRSCKLSYSDYKEEEGVSFSQLREIHVWGKKEIEIELEYKQYKFNETLTFPFRVPKNYTDN